MNAVFAPPPKTWPEVKLRYLANCQLGKALPSGAMDEHGKYPVFRAAGVQGHASQYTHSGPHVLICRRGEHCGETIWVTGEFWATDHLIVVQAKEEVCDARWLEIALRAMELRSHFISSTSSVPSISISSLLDLTIALPPLAEQLQIGGYVREETQRMDATINEMKNIIALTQERRIALAQAAAAGQLHLQDLT